MVAVSTAFAYRAIGRQHRAKITLSPTTSRQYVRAWIHFVEYLNYELSVSRLNHRPFANPINTMVLGVLK